MIYLSASLPKSASTLLYAYTEEMLHASGRRNGQAALRRLIQEGRLQGVDTFLEHVRFKEVLYLLWLNLWNGDVLIKTHAAPGFWVRQLVRLGLMRASYIYRDPRDVLLSGMDHARRTAETPMARFQHYDSLENGLLHLKWILRRTNWWLDFGKAHFMTYEGLLTQPQTELVKLSRYFGWSLTEAQIEAIIQQEAKARSYGKRQFNTGKLSRYAKEMSPAQQARCREVLGADIKRLGFTFEPHPTLNHPTDV